MSLSLHQVSTALGLPSLLKPQVRWAPKIAGQAARLGTLVALGYQGYQAFAANHYSFTGASLLQNAALVVSPVLVSRFASSAASSLTTRALWNPIRRETLRDADQSLNKAVLESSAAQAAVEKDAPGSLGRYNNHFSAVKKQTLIGGLLYAGATAALSYMYLHQFG